MIRRGASVRRRLGYVGVGIAVFLLAVPVATHTVIGLVAPMAPPAFVMPAGDVVVLTGRDLQRLGRAYARHRGSILEVRLEGSPAEIGTAHGRLLRDEMIANEGALYGEFRQKVPLWAARQTIVDLSRFEFRRIDRQLPEVGRVEIAAQAAAMDPDPYRGFLPTYDRLVFLNALYDVSLAFEHSPLLGCTSFALTGDAAWASHTVLARNFDFEAGPMFDDHKAVFLVRESGRIPYASVAWPGLIGGFTGMNAEGVALVVHGGRAERPTTHGEPVLHTMRRVLGSARSTDEAMALLAEAAPMVSHLVMVVDAGGNAAVAERAPGAAMYVRRGTHRFPLTNHFEGHLAADPANTNVLARTSTLARRARLDELLSALPPQASVDQIVGVLRDRKGPGGVSLPLGSRCAIDALIATHSVVMDATARAIWVSEGPHLVGRYLRFDLARLLRGDYEPDPEEPLEALPADTLQTSGAYVAWAQAGSAHGPESGPKASCHDRHP